MSTINMPGPGPNINHLPGNMAHINDREIKDIYDDYTFKNNIVNK